NIQADFKSPAPPVLHPGTGQPIGPQDLAPLFPMELIKQEVSRARWIEIPDEVRDILKLWRPSPLFRARRLEKALGTPARIYYKYEGVSPAGSHKPNTAVAQAYYNKKEKVTRLSTETGAGQWGSALSTACSWTRPSWATRRRSSWRRPTTRRTASSAAPAAAPTSPGSPSRSPPTSSPASARRRGSSRWSRPRARASPRASTPTTSATPSG